MNDVTGMPQSVLVIGGTSDIARAALRLLAGRRMRSVVLASRDETVLAERAAELHALGVADVHTMRLDVTDIASHEAFVAGAVKALGDIDLVLVAAGVLGTADLVSLGAGGVADIFGANATGPAALLALIAQRLRSQGHGRVVVLSTVAGVRVRASNFVYGSAKAGLDAFAQGLNDALAGSGVHVLVIRLGYVHSKMTVGVEPAPFAIDAEEAGRAVVALIGKGATGVAWVPPILRVLFAVLRVVPLPIWRKMDRPAPLSAPTS